MDDINTDTHIEKRYMELIGAVVRVACLDFLAIEKPEYRLTEYRIDEDGPTA